jgi:predicted AlkP superfamily phosphohydrolase/phosphomutase
MQQGPRVVVIGLDCGTPKLLFDDLHAEVPTIAKLMGEGLYGDLASITPPITVPAWACGFTGTTPGQLGLYGFRHRKDTTYEGLSIATSGRSKCRRWDALVLRASVLVLIGVPRASRRPRSFRAGASGAS